MKLLNLEWEKVNKFGGAVALGILLDQVVLELSETYITFSNILMLKLDALQFVTEEEELQQSSLRE